MTEAPEVRFVRFLHRLSPRDDRMNGEQDGPCTYNATLGRVRVTIVAVENSKSYVFFVYVALVIHHTMRMRLIILSSVACPTLQYFST